MKTSLKIQHRRAFSLLEFIGALAILTILASIITPVVIRRLDQAARAREISDLTAISNALVLQMLKSNTISSASTWATDAATWTLLPVSAISQNPRHYNRVLFIDTNGWLGTVSLPFTQGIGGTTNAPAQARMVIVSCLSGTNGVSQSSGSLAASLFNDLWNTPQGYKPNTWTNWRGNTEDVFVQRLNLQPLFHRVMLFNQTGSTNSCAYAINGSSTAIVTNELNSYYLDGTILGLYTNGGATATLQTSETVNRDLSRLFLERSTRPRPRHQFDANRDGQHRLRLH
jgi:type II secretory pathway pseudopilin PulG